MHSTDIYIGISSYFTDGTKEPGTIQVVNEQEVTFAGGNINPVVINPDNVCFPTHYGCSHNSSACAGGDCYGNKIGIIFAGSFLLFHYGKSTPGSYYVGIDQINPFLTYLLK